MIGIKKFDEAREYWLDKLAELPDVSPLAPDFAVSGSAHVVETSFHLDSALASRLEQMGKGNHLSVYIILQTAFKILLSAFTDRDDLVVVSPVYDTNIQEYNRVVLLRDRLDVSLTFKEFLLRVRATVLDGYRHQYYPVEKLLDLLGLSTASPLFSFGFLHSAIHQRAFVQDYCRKNSAHVIVEYGVDENGGHMKILYDSKRFSAGTIQSFVNSFIHILRQAANQPSAGIQEIRLLTDDVKERVLREFNDTASAFPQDRTLHQLFHDVSSRFRDRTALWGWSEISRGRDVVSYGELARQAAAIVPRLRAAGAGENSVVGLLFEPSVEMIVAIFGVLGARAAYLPMDPAFPQTRIEFMCRDSGVDVVVAQERFRWLVPQDCECLFAGGGGNEEVAPVVESGDNPAELAYTIYTSGTTGDPKGVQVEHRGVVNYIFWRLTTYGVTPEDVSLQPLSYCFDGFVSNMYTPLLSGGLLVMVPEEDRLDFAAMAGLVERHRVTNVSLVPGLFGALLDYCEVGQLRSLRFVVLAGEATQSRLLVRIKKELPDVLLINEYGPTEASVTAAALVGMDGEPGIVGRPIANTSIYILDRRLKPVPPGAAGQLFITGPGLARAYANSAELTARKFVPVPRDIFDSTNGERMYASGDLARFREDGQIQLLGRTDLQVKIRGHRIELEEIENRLGMVESLKEAVAVAREEKNGDQYICAYVVGRDGTHANSETIRRELEAHLPGYMIPRFIVMMESLPRNPSGKINRKELLLPGIVADETNDEVLPGSIEDRMRSLWSGVLGIEAAAVSIGGSFFSMGGDSFKAMALQRNIQAEFNVKIPLAIIFKNPTIKDLIHNLEGGDLEFSRHGDPQLECLKWQANSSGNLFLVHGGNGEVDGYAELCSLLAPDFAYWGIKAKKPVAGAPFNITIEELAAAYIEKILILQPQGPYYVFGWCIGGNIAFEIARQLEQMNREVAMIALVDADAPDEEAAAAAEPFAVARELELLEKAVPHISGDARLDKSNGLEELWTSIVDILGQSKDGALQLKQKIPSLLSHAIPNFDDLELEPFLEFFNLGRSLSRARLLYRPEHPVAAPVSFFQIQDHNNAEWRGWQRYCDKPLKVFEVRGDHFSVLKSPFVGKLAGLVGGLLQR